MAECIKLQPERSHAHITVLLGVPAAPLAIQVLAQAPQRAVAADPCTHVGDLGGGPGSWPRPFSFGL